MTIGLDLRTAAQERLPTGACLPTNAAERKAVPLAEGLLYYFPNALAEVARVSKRGNDQHNAGQRMHWAMEKSTDHADCILRHLIDAGTMDGDGQRHTAKVAWRALALLEIELLADGAAPGRNAVRLPPSPDYGPASVAFQHGDLGRLGEHSASEVCAACGKADTSAAEIADADGCAEYGNPVTPGCAVPTADDKTHRTFDVDLTRTAFFYTTDGVYHAYAQAWKP